jgi:hypothetical protein
VRESALMVLVNKSEAVLPYYNKASKLKRNPSKRGSRLATSIGSHQHSTSVSPYDTAPVEFVSAALDVGKAGFRTWAIKVTLKTLFILHSPISYHLDFDLLLILCVSPFLH